MDQTPARETRVSQPGERDRVALAQLMISLFILFLSTLFGPLSVAAGDPVAHEAAAPHVEPDFKFSMIAHWSMPKEFKFKKVRVGGLSGCAYDHDTLYAISDDRGKFSDPRFYKMKLNLNPQQFSATVTESVTLKNKSKSFKFPQVFDTEGIAMIENHFLFSSEGDNDHKPRVPSQLLLFKPDGVAKSIVSLPEDLNPEASGPQRRGYQNNKALEGLSYDAKTDTLWTAFESPLIQDLDLDGVLNYIRILKVPKAKDFLLKSEGEVSLPAHETIFYKLEPSDKNDAGAEVFKGVSEILAFGKHLLVMERGVRLAGAGWKHSVKIFAIDLTKVKTYKKPFPERGKIEFPEKKLLVDFEKKNSWGLGDVENFEALCLGPVTDGQPSLFVLSDDNFSSHSRTQLVWFKMK